MFKLIFVFYFSFWRKWVLKNSVNPDLENLKHLMNDMIESLSAKNNYIFTWNTYGDITSAFMDADNQLTWYPKPKKNTFFWKVLSVQKNQHM